ncbi:hypothetical protein D3C72_1790810 [compost metagenome]
MNGTRSLAPATNMRDTWRTWARASTSGPTMKPGVSINDTIGSPCALHTCMKRAALSAASASMAPPRWRGLLARMPTGRPSMRASAVWMPVPKPARSSSTLPASATPAIAARVSYTRRRFSGTTWRSASGSGACHAATRPWNIDR